MAWNIERGRRPDLWVVVPAIAAADVLLLTEVDRGMARTGNRHLARELAEQLGMAYAFGPAFRELTRGGRLERLRSRGQSNAEALHGVAVLSRLAPTVTGRSASSTSWPCSPTPPTATGEVRRRGHLP